MDGVYQRFPPRALYSYDADKVSDETGLDCNRIDQDTGELREEDVSRTHQSFADEADINTLIRRFGLDGQMPSGVRMPVFGDFTGLTDFRSAIHAVEAAEESFMALPARVRARFENDPGQFVAFCSDPKNHEEALQMGLVDAPVAPVASPAVPAAPVSPAAPAAPAAS